MRKRRLRDSVTELLSEVVCEVVSDLVRASKLCWRMPLGHPWKLCPVLPGQEGGLGRVVRGDDSTGCGSSWNQS